MPRRPLQASSSLFATCALVVALLAAPALATPSFARQTGFSCSQCHTQFPELTAFGRAFKAGGYTMTLKPSIKEQNGDRAVLDMIERAPLSLMVQVSLTHTAKAQTTAGAPAPLNDDVQLPQQLSLFYAGRIAPEVGAFTQLTYSGTDDHLSIDNTDLRWAHPMTVGEHALTVGMSLNNNPTVQDLWNSTPAWGYPWASSEVAPTGSAAPLIAGGLAQTVAGLGAYADYDGWAYAELSAYHAAPLGVTRPVGAGNDAAQVVSGVAPYWRLAVEKDVDQHAISAGTFGMLARLFPGADQGLPLGGATDRYLDTGFDAQYQYVGERNIITASATFIHESQSLDATFGAGGVEKASHDLNSFQVTAAYLWARTVGLRMSYFDTNGTSDAVLYAPGGISGSANGSPLTQGITGELSYTPWLNTKFVLQETAYFDFNGSRSNYDGAGRDASANDTTYLLAWLSF